MSDILENTSEIVVGGEMMRVVNARQFIYLDGRKIGAGKIIQIGAGALSPQSESSVISQAPVSLNKEVTDVTA